MKQAGKTPSGPEKEDVDTKTTGTAAPAPAPAPAPQKEGSGAREKKEGRRGKAQSKVKEESEDEIPVLVPIGGTPAKGNAEVLSLIFIVIVGNAACGFNEQARAETWAVVSLLTESPGSPVSLALGNLARARAARMRAPETSPAPQPRGLQKSDCVGFTGSVRGTEFFNFLIPWYSFSSFSVSVQLGKGLLNMRRKKGDSEGPEGCSHHGCSLHVPGVRRGLRWE